MRLFISKFTTSVATVVAVLLLSVSCTENDSLEIQPSRSVVNPHAVPLDSALVRLERFLDGIDGHASKAGSSRRRVASAFPVKTASILTKSAAEGLGSEDMLYIVNFEDEQGYALVSADDRIDEDVIMVTDSGSLSTERYLNLVQPGIRTIYPQYPLDGPGTFTLEDDPDEVYMNPNTFQLYDSIAVDFYVGDFRPNMETEETDSGEPIESIVLSMSTTYAANQLDRSEEMTDFDDSSVVTVSEYGELYGGVEGLLQFAVTWSQGAPYNKYCPIVKDPDNGRKTNAYAGCVPLAAAKIIAYHQIPNVVEYNGHICKMTDLIHGDDLNKEESLSVLLRYLGARAYSMYFSKGTFTFPGIMANVLGSIGYGNAKVVNFSASKVINMLDTGRPVMIFSVPKLSWYSYDLARSHGWNIDGYKMRPKTTTTYYYDGDILVDTESYTHSSYVIHCDFGWGGRCNGYYIPGIFDLDDAEVYDKENDTGRNINYNWYLKILTYEMEK